MPVTLTVVEGPVTGLTFSFAGPGTFLVGRASRAQFQFPSGPDGDLRVSHSHFLVEVNLPQCHLHDLNSVNHTFVNGKPVASCELRPGDQIKAGHSIIRVEWPKEDDQSTSDWSGVLDVTTVPPERMATPVAVRLRKLCPACRQPRGTTAEPLCAACRKSADTLPQVLPG